MSGTTGSVAGTGPTIASGAHQNTWLRPGQAEVNDFNLALRGAAQAEGGQEPGSGKKKEAVADDSKRPALADESTRSEGANLVPQDVVTRILRRGAERQQRQALALPQDQPSPQGRTQTGQAEDAQQKPPSSGAGGQKTTPIEIGIEGTVTAQATTDASNPYLGPRRNVNEPGDLGFAASGRFYVARNITPKVTASAFASGAFNAFLDETGANGRGWGAGGSVKVKLDKFQLGGEFQRQYAYDASGIPIFAANNISATVEQSINVYRATTVTSSATFEYRDADALGFTRSRFTTAVDIKHPLNSGALLVGSGRLSAFHFTDGGNAGRTDVIPFVKAGIEYKGATFALEYAKRLSTQSGRGYDDTVIASVTFNFRHKVVK